MRQVAVVPELQRQGIGKAPIKFSEALARQNGYPAQPVIRGIRNDIEGLRPDFR
jgi:GNAT superfamily N-acetyltransferase